MQNPTICCQQKTHFKHKGINRLKEKMLILIKRKLEWYQNRTRVKNIVKDKEDCFIIVTGLFHQQEQLILSVYVSNNKASTYMKRN